MDFSLNFCIVFFSPPAFSEVLQNAFSFGTIWWRLSSVILWLINMKYHPPMGMLKVKLWKQPINLTQYEWAWSVVPALKITHSEFAWIETWICGRERTLSPSYLTCSDTFLHTSYQGLTSCWSHSRFPSKPFKDNPYSLPSLKPPFPLGSSTSTSIFSVLCFPLEQQEAQHWEGWGKARGLTCVVVDQEWGCLPVGSPPQGQEVPCRGELPGTHALPASHHAHLQHQRKQENHREQQTVLTERWVNILKRGIQQKRVQNAFVCWNGRW